MCGRFTLTYSKEELNSFLKNTYNIEEINHEVTLPRYNIAPSQQVLAIIHDGKRYRAGYLAWGLIPVWATPSNYYNMINVRSETIKKKQSFDFAFKSHRCIILADGFYEWQTKDTGKQPMHIHLKTRSIFGFAGLYHSKLLNDGTKAHTCAIITTSSNDLMKDIHNRMPVILPNNAHKTWLKPNTKKELLTPYLKGFPSNEMTYYPVSTSVNKVTQDDPSLIQPIV
ncbi:MAG: SOS response-associated peptidase [Bacillota bacterium]